MAWVLPVNAVVASAPESTPEDVGRMAWVHRAGVVVVAGMAGVVAVVRLRGAAGVAGPTEK